MEKIRRQYKPAHRWSVYPQEMLKYLGMVVFIFGAACSKGDKCERAYDKIAPLMKALEKDSKRDDKDDRATMVGKCKADLKDHPDREKVIDCILGVSGELTMEKMAGCEKDIKAERKKDKDGGSGGAAAAAKTAEMMAKMTEFKDQMCACTDSACGTKVSDAMGQWNQEMAKDMQNSQKMSEEDTKKATEIATKFGECMQKVMTPATAPATK